MDGTHMIIVGIFLVLVGVILTFQTKDNNNVECIGGYTFTTHNVQILDNLGHGIPCTK